MTSRPERAAGILLHPTSLAGPYGIGDLGREARRFVDFLADAGMSLWQILPLGPTGFGDSPYACFSTFAGNPLLIDLDGLVAEGLLRPEDLASPPDLPAESIDYGAVHAWKRPRLERAAARFLASAAPAGREGFDAFCAEHAHWLDDYALFMAVKARFDDRAAREGVADATWYAYWELDVRLRQADALARWRSDCAAEAETFKVLQYVFFRQWASLKSYANSRGVRIVGDVPIYVAPDGVDAWASPHLFKLGPDGRPSVVAGVPPDYFSETGQLWGNPLYDWERMAEDGFSWWVARFRAMLSLTDFIRIDHFRGFAACWEVPAGEETAVRGEWVETPGRELFAAVRRELGSLPLLAEDLGIITAEVEVLRDELGFPGMRVLQFAFEVGEGGRLVADHPFLPHNHVERSVVYTGTHDNDTTRGWYDERTPQERHLVRSYAACDDAGAVWSLIRLALSSVARFAIVPMQDTLGLGTWARMNRPSEASGNWAWRMRADALHPDLASALRELVQLYGRAPE